MADNAWEGGNPADSLRSLPHAALVPCGACAWFEQSDDRAAP